MTKEEILAAWEAVLTAIPRAKKAATLNDACTVESALRAGLRSLSVLVSVRQYILDSPSLGGEDSPFVKQIDAILPRE